MQCVLLIKIYLPLWLHQIIKLFINTVRCRRSSSSSFSLMLLFVVFFFFSSFFCCWLFGISLDRVCNYYQSCLVVHIFHSIKYKYTYKCTTLFSTYDWIFIEEQQRTPFISTIHTLTHSHYKYEWNMAYILYNIQTLHNIVDIQTRIQSIIGSSSDSRLVSQSYCVWQASTINTIKPKQP